ncbi:MAG: carboxypeptidase regulatory-like domain-containing protein, partial [Candidatus Dormibacteria bacterium]
MSQTVGTGSPPSSVPSGVRWYELDAPAGATSMSAWTVAQQGTYLPTDGSSRWMGSIAMDHSGDIALGYSLSSSSINPSIAYTGRLAGDPAGMMTQPETTILTGGGVQESTANRWGDYSSMAIDPTDDCTFWYSQEFYATTGSFAWSTHIAAFKFPSCTVGPTGTLSGQVTDAGTGNPIVGATITLTPNQITTVTDSSGNYTLTVPVGAYTATASDFGYLSQSDSETISNGVTTTQNFALTLAPSATVSGNITDGTPSGHTYGLYGEIKVTAQGVGQVADLWANPKTGAYTLNLPEGGTYTFAVTPYLTGYTPA